MEDESICFDMNRLLLLSSDAENELQNSCDKFSMYLIANITFKKFTVVFLNSSTFRLLYVSLNVENLPHMYLFF